VERLREARSKSQTTTKKNPDREQVGKRALKYWLTSQDTYNTDPFRHSISRVNGVFSLARSGSNTNAQAMTWYVPCAFLGCVRAGGSEAQESRRCPAATTIFTGPRPPLVRGASAAKTSVCHDYWLGAAIEIRRLRANKTAAEKQTWIMGPIQRRERCGGIGWSADPFLLCVCVFVGF
jgi:hypothetical protein